MSITIKELANLANTSTATVSRVLSNKPGVAEARRQKILELAQRLGYSPNRIARSLATQKSQSLGFIAADLANPVYIDFLHRVQTYLEEQEYAVLVADSKRDIEKEKENVSLMREHCVDGLIIFPVHDWNVETDVEHFMNLKMVNFPFILMGKVDGYGFDYVSSEEIETGKKIVAELAKHGHQRIGFVGRTQSNRAVQERFLGVELGVKETGIKMSEEFIVDWAQNYDDQIKKMLSSKNPPTALVMVNDISGLIAYRPIVEMGLKIPDDVSVISFGEGDFSPHLNPPLSGTRSQTDEVAKVALDILMKKIDTPGANDPVNQREIPQNIIVRESIGNAKS